MGATAGGEHKAVVVAVGHDNGTDNAGGHSPGCLVRIAKLVFTVGKLDSEGLGKAVAEIMAGSALKSLAVVHHGLYGIGGLGSGEFFLVGFLALYNVDGKCVAAKIGINVSIRSVSSLASSAVSCMVWPSCQKKFGGAEEGRVVFPNAQRCTIDCRAWADRGRNVLCWHNARRKEFRKWVERKDVLKAPLRRRG